MIYHQLWIFLLLNNINLSAMKLKVQSLVFNPFQVNTYIVSAENGDCAIIDPACYEAREKKALSDFLEKENLNPKMVLITHAHIDHILGASFVIDTYKIPMGIHAAGTVFLENAAEYGMSFGFNIEKTPEPGFLLTENQEIKLDGNTLEVLYTPGHADGSICFRSENDNFVIVGDVLFNGSIGRTDLPTGHFDTLIKNIQEKLMILPDETLVYSGHGPATTIGYERNHNPFLANH